MSVLSSLKLISVKKRTQVSAAQQRRNKLARRLGEQMELARAAQSGSTFAVKRLKNIVDAEGNRRAVEVAKRVKAWWFTSDSGQLCFDVRYGAKVIELAKGKTSIEVASPDELIPTIELIKSAVEAGELDAQLEAASSSLRNGFKR